MCQGKGTRAPSVLHMSCSGCKVAPARSSTMLAAAIQVRVAVARPAVSLAASAVRRLAATVSRPLTTVPQPWKTEVETNKASIQSPRLTNVGCSLHRESLSAGMNSPQPTVSRALQGRFESSIARAHSGDRDKEPQPLDEIYKASKTLGSPFCVGGSLGQMEVSCPRGAGVNTQNGAVLWLSAWRHDCTGASTCISGSS